MYLKAKFSFVSEKVEAVTTTQLYKTENRL